jgi:hypothetical protein
MSVDDFDHSSGIHSTCTSSLQASQTLTQQRFAILDCVHGFLCRNCNMPNSRGLGFFDKNTPTKHEECLNNVGRKGHKNGILDDKTMTTRTTIYDKVVVYMDGAYVGNIGKRLLLQKMVNYNTSSKNAFCRTRNWMVEVLTTGKCALSFIIHSMDRKR